MSPAALPNFFLVGAPKAGTTSLYRYLDQHPAVYMSPVKEPCFFAPDVIDADPTVRARGVVLDWSDYEDLFAGVAGETAIGEASVAYLASAGAAKAIHARLPHARILVMVRDPAERLFSHYTAARVAGATRATFLDWLDRQMSLERAGSLPFGPIQAGRYALNLQRYLDRFPARQIHVDLFEDYSRDPAGTLAAVFRFLEVESDRPIDMTRRHNVTVAPRWPAATRVLRPLVFGARRLAPALVDRVRDWTHAPVSLQPTPADRARAIDLYGDDVRALAALIGRDLAAWLKA